jgi:hypothetical protein
MSKQLTLWSPPESAPAVPTLTKAAQWITDGLTAVLPPGVPVSFRRIINATMKGKTKAVAALEMFDGKTSRVEVSKWSSRFTGAWAVQWLESGNKPCFWNGTAWERIDLDI